MKKKHTDRNALPQKTMSYIASKTKMTSRNVGLSFADEDDLRQQLYLSAVKARDRFDEDAEASLETFLHLVIDRAVLNFLRDRRREKRSKVLLILDAPVCDNGFTGDEEKMGEDGQPMVETIEDESPSAVGISDLRHDVAYAVGRLDEKSRELCRLIMDGCSIRAAARKMHLPFWRVQRKILPAIAKDMRNLLDS